MTKAVTLAAVLLVALCWRSVSGQCIDPNENRPPNGLKSLYSGQREFSLKLLQAINQLTPKENVFFSPYSTYHALLLAYMISANHTEQSLKKALHFGDNYDKVDVEYAYKLNRLRAQTQRPTSYDFTSANRIYVTNETELRKCALDLFAEELIPTSFQSNPESVRTEINSWVEEKTKHMIKDLLPPGAVGLDTTLVLLNAAYFKGLWASKFDAQNTKKDIFYISHNEQKFVPMMTQKGTFNYHPSDALKAHVLELPYKGDDVSMFILLPAISTDIDEVLTNLRDPKIFIEIVNGSVMEQREVVVSLPKFTLESSIELLPVLHNIGAGEVFAEDADFTYLAPFGNLTLGNALHKARIEVTEEGTKAAASTVLFTFRSSRPLDPAQFICNHPFIYMIYSHTEQAILFNGVYRRP